jgi:hypothetical protein
MKSPLHPPLYSSIPLENGYRMIILWVIFQLTPILIYDIFQICTLLRGDIMFIEQITEHDYHMVNKFVFQLCFLGIPMCANGGPKNI